MKCDICQEEITEKQGFVSNVNIHGKAVSNEEELVFVCSDRCKEIFESRLPFNGRPLYHLSRITGYVQIVDNWNDGKKQEFIDRKRQFL